MEDGGIKCIFSLVFMMQSPSFLAWQRDMQEQKGLNNAQTQNLFVYFWSKFV
jgi:hypothetical protein